MIRHNEQTGVGIFAVYPNRESVERALRRLRDDGFDMRDVSVIGRGFEATEVPAGVVTTGDIAGASAGVGAVAGFLCGLAHRHGRACRSWPGARVRSGFPRRGDWPVPPKGPSSVRSSAGWGEPWSGGESLSVHVQRYETHVSEGRFLVFARTDSAGVEYTQSVLAPGALDQPVVYEIGGVNTWPPQRSRPTACSCGLDTPREVGARTKKGSPPSIGEASSHSGAGSGGLCDDRRSGISDRLRLDPRRERHAGVPHPSGSTTPRPRPKAGRPMRPATS